MRLHCTPDDARGAAEAVLGCIIAISGGVFYALARNRLQSKIKAQEAAAAKKAEAPAAAQKA